MEREQNEERQRSLIKAVTNRKADKNLLLKLVRLRQIVNKNNNKGDGKH